MTLRSMPWVRSQAAASKSWDVVELKVKAPVSSNMPRPRMVASSSVSMIWRDRSSSMMMEVVAPHVSTRPWTNDRSSSESGWWSKA